MIHSMTIQSEFHPVADSQLIQTGYNASKYEGGRVIMSFVSLPLLKECQILSLALKNMLITSRFSEEYATLLQEHMRAEDYEEAMQEFHERTADFEREPRQISDAEIASEAKLLLSAIGEELDSEELAVMINADVFKVEYALRKYSMEIFEHSREAIAMKLKQD